MKKTVSLWQMAGFVFTAAAGTLLHFLFDWSGKSVVVALFAAVNESVWEHLKLLFYPMLIFAIVEYVFWGREASGFWCVKLIGILLSFAVVLTVYYTYTGALGVNADWLNIALFFIAAGAGFWAETKLLQRSISCGKWAILALLLLVTAFAIWTFSPPEIPLFQDPSTAACGLQK